MAIVSPSFYKSSLFLDRFPSRVGKSPCRRSVGSRHQKLKVTALFWGSKIQEERELDYSLEVSLAQPGAEAISASANEMKPQRVSVLVVSSILDIPSDEWDACVLDATGVEKFNPFLTHGFLSSLEETGCAVKETGWMPRHIIAKDELDNLLGVVPLYLKSHSYGEYVFDHSWADAYYRYGSKYYPKLQCCVPFTPVTGPRILLRNTSFRDQIFDIIISAMKDFTSKSQVSSLHITFSSEKEWHNLKGRGFLPRVGMQYHWKNRNYKNFNEFLMDMKQNKRKNINRDRKKISAQSLTIKRLRGYEIKAKHWDSFYMFYRNTTDSKRRGRTCSRSP